MSAQRPTLFRSIATWPEPVRLGNDANESTDTHATREQAEAVCQMLQARGFGGNCQIFPLSVRVEEVAA